MRLHGTLALAFFIALLARAQDNRRPEQPGQREGRGTRGGRFPGPSVGFSALDTDGDQTLSAAEIDAAPKALAKLDKNSDGQITSEEIRMAMPQGRGRGGPGGPGGVGRGPEGSVSADMVEETLKTLMAFDANGDGKLSKSELPERFQGMFDRGDENKDGFLTPDEIRTMAAKQAPPPDSGGRGEGRGREMNFLRMDPILAAIDTDGDGVISAEEIRKSSAAIRKLDKDGNGIVTREEAAPADRGREF